MTPLNDTHIAGSALTQKDVNGLVRRIGVLTAGMSGWMHVQVVPGNHWAATVGADKTLIYDLGLAAELARGVGGSDAITGVIAHEIGHLRATDNPRFAKADVSEEVRAEAFHMLNLVEDKRIEIIMAREFPGMASKIDKLRDGIRNPEMKAIMERVHPRHQLLNAIYGRLWDDAVVPVHPGALAAWVKAAPLFDELTALWEAMPTDADERGYMTTNQLWKRLVAGGVWASYLELRDAQDPAARMPDTPALPQMPQDDQGGIGQDDDTASSGGVDDAPGSDDGLSSSLPTTPGDDDDTAGGGGDAASVTAGQLAALPEDVRNRIFGQLDDAAATPGQLTGEEQALAQKLREDLEQAEAKVDATGNDIQNVLNEQDDTDDDRRLALGDNIAAYRKVTEEDWMRSQTMGRRFASILRENRYDRWGSQGHDSGPRIRTRALAGVRTGRTDVFMRKERLRNRRYAVSILCDASPSMWASCADGQDRMTHALRATVMAAEALDSVQGCEVSVWGFGAVTGALKPFDRTLAQRRGQIGELARKRVFGGATTLAPALARVGRDLAKRFGNTDDVRKLIVLITDGQPSDGVESSARIIAQLKREHGVEVVGIGVGVRIASLERAVDGWQEIASAQELPKALGRALDQRVRKAR